MMTDPRSAYQAKSGPKENDPNRNGGRQGDPTPTGPAWDPKGKLDHLRKGGR